MPPPQSVLLVEDDDRTRDLFAAALKISGYRVIAVRDGVDALRMIEASLPSVIVLDLGLPYLSGADVLKEISADAATRHIPVVIVTGLDAPMIDATVPCVLHKPIDPAEVVTAVRRCITMPRMTPPPIESV